ncbi:hypothetical protein JTE90_013164 [Oedothorax gibbosus]|uniref:La-related protein 6 n=1 Tax=Oedothorax gibbosus TaxID=931172 RepID=A0AAV6UBS5_9ARAC|nr:hypothetical protein JTE90_013164 [Oedothorax gibbosus]
MSVEIVTMRLEDITMDMPPLILVSSDDNISCDSQSDGLNMSDSEPKDSGIDCDSSEQKLLADIPDPETTEKIMKTVEFYLSDANILKDPFLLKHVRRNKEGYVSLKLLASFRKLKSLSRNWKAVSHSVQKSSLLSLNSDGTKVRRLAPLPDHDETVISRSIIVSGFNSENPSSEISDMFSKFGDISLVRIIRPGGTIPSDVKKLFSQNPDLSSNISALVEFEEHSSAQKALDSKQTDGISVIPVLVKEKAKSETSTEPGAPPKESPKKKKKNRRSSNTDKKLLEDDKDSEQTRTRRTSSGSMSSQSSGYLSSSPNSPFDSKFPRRHSYNTTDIYNDPKSSFASLSSRQQRNPSKERIQQRRGTEGSLSSPWRRRREQMMLSDSNLLATSASTGSLVMQKSHPVHTIRMPRGPDGTNGFGTRPRLPSTAE